ncbi:ABC transporter permease [Ihuprevotella massiliensis]|uniref:ABC transporter permease n=1 Tax=Ihuprevotella massiliensis TaxID=1852368 RepID=UPI00094F10E7
MWHDIFIRLQQNKLRTALTGLSVSVGIFLLIVLLGAGNGLIHAFNHNNQMFSTDAISIYPGYTSKPFKGWKEDRNIKFDNIDVDNTAVVAKNKVKSTAGKLTSSEKTASAHQHYFKTTLYGQSPEAYNIERLSLAKGRYINELDIKEQRKVVVMPDYSAEETFGSIEAAIGDYLNIDSVAYQVVGVLESNGNKGQSRCHIPFTTYRTIFHTGFDIPEIVVQTYKPEVDESFEALRAAWCKSLGARHDFAEDDESAVWISSVAQGAKEQNLALTMLQRALWVIGLLTLMSGVVSISNIMLITVKERTKEFGIRKALGARPWAILRSVLAESVIITLFFGYIGLVAGIAATEWMNVVSGQQVTEFLNFRFYTFLDPTIDMSVAFSALLTLIIAGLLAGFFPARRAVKIKPITALNAK